MDRTPWMDLPGPARRIRVEPLRDPGPARRIRVEPLRDPVPNRAPAEPAETPPDHVPEHAPPVEEPVHAYEAPTVYDLDDSDFDRFRDDWRMALRSDWGSFGGLGR